MTAPTISTLKDKFNTSTLHLALLSIAAGAYNTTDFID